MRPPILAFAPHGWHDRWLSRQHLLSRLAGLGWPVLYSFGPLSVWDRSTALWQQAGWLGGLDTSDGVLLDRPGRWPPRWPKQPWWDDFALDRHAARLSRVFTEKKRVALLFHPRFWPYVERLRPAWVIYHVYDVYALMEDWTPQYAAWEKALTQRADLITTSSPDMAAHLPTPGPGKARVLENAGDVSRYLAVDAPCPADLATIPHPRIGYAGTLNAKVDFTMIQQVARQRPDWHWVLLGPELFSPHRQRDQESLAAWRACLALDNVHYLGQKSRQAVPAYLHHMDVNTICYRITQEDWVVHGYPVKFHECLATGRPLVVAPQSVLREKFSHVAAMATTPQEWISALQGAIWGEGVATPRQRRQVAMDNSWEARVATLQGWMGEFIEF